MNPIPESSIVFHVGLPKSGTTALQLFLKDFGNSFNLTYMRYPGQLDLQSRFLFRAFAQDKRRLPEQERAVCLDWIRQTAAQAGSKKLVFSDEVLTQIDFIDRDEFVTFCKELASDRPIVAILYVRPFFSWLESLINQLTKNGNFYFRSFSPESLERIGRFSVALDKVADFYRSAGFDTRVFAYPSDIVQDFATRLGLDTAHIPQKGTRANRSPENLLALREFARVRGNKTIKNSAVDALAGRTFLSRKHVDQIWETHGESLSAFERDERLAEGAVDDYASFRVNASENGLIEEMTRALSAARLGR